MHKASDPRSGPNWSPLVFKPLFFTSGPDAKNGPWWLARMCPLSPHESLSGSVMTRRSGGRVQRSRNLSHTQQQHSSVPESCSATSLDVGEITSLSPESSVAGVLSKRHRRFACSCLRHPGLRRIDVLTQASSSVDYGLGLTLSLASCVHIPIVSFYFILPCHFHTSVALVPCLEEMIVIGRLMMEGLKTAELNYFPFISYARE